MLREKPPSALMKVPCPHFPEYRWENHDSERERISLRPWSKLAGSKSSDHTAPYPNMLFLIPLNSTSFDLSPAMSRMVPVILREVKRSTAMMLHLTSEAEPAQRHSQHQAACTHA